MNTLSDIKFYINRFGGCALSYIQEILTNSYDFLIVCDGKTTICRIKGCEYHLYEKDNCFDVVVKKDKKRVFKETVIR